MNPLGKTPVAMIAVVLVALLPALALFFTVTKVADLADSGLPTAVVAHEPPPFDAQAVSEDVLWLARCAYSETKRPEEQRLVAWVLRNRVETRYRGARGYREVVLDPYQFSAFNPGNPKRRHYTRLAPAADARGWARALEVAHEVYYAPGSERPFPVETRHFYSERSMVDQAAPDWAEGHRPVQPAGIDVDPRRFRFYRGVAATTPAAPVLPQLFGR